MLVEGVLREALMVVRLVVLQVPTLCLTWTLIVPSSSPSELSHPVVPFGPLHSLGCSW